MPAFFRLQRMKRRRGRGEHPVGSAGVCHARGGGCSKRVLTLHRGTHWPRSWHWWPERAHGHCRVFLLPCSRPAGKRWVLVGFFSVILSRVSRLNGVVSPV